MEDGYIRYDYDEDGYNNAKSIGAEDRHPLNHYDIFYSSQNTFKIGLNNKINEDSFIDFIDINKKCKNII